MQLIRQFLKSDTLVVILAIAAIICAIIAYRIWRSPQSWHIDGETKELHFHGWPEILMAGAGAVTFVTLTILTI